MDTQRERQVESRSRWLARLREGAVDLALTVGQMAVFFLVFMAILLWSFPRGTGLTDLYGELVDPGGRARRQLRQSATGLDDIAVLASLNRSVKERPADAVTWRDAQAGMPLGNQHAIQTAGRSTASIRFNASNVLQMSENSLVIVQRPERGRRSRTASLVVLGGRIRGRVEPTAGRAAPVELLVADASSVIRPDGDRPAEYDITLDQGGAATLSVYSGVAEVSRDGKTAEVRSNQSLTVMPDVPLGRADWIPGSARPVEPTDGQQVTFGASAPQVRFRWSDAENAGGYRLVIARDADFQDVVHEVATDATELVQGNLHAGRYYWRVDGVNGKARSLPGPAHALELERDSEPPPLEVSLPEDVVEQDHLVVRGSTAPGARVTVGEREVAVASDGLFELELALRPGPNLIVVEALDAAGNVAYHSKYVHAKY